MNSFEQIYALGIKKKCPVCSKDFIFHLGNPHCYNIKSSDRTRDIPVCSWTCMRTWENNTKSDAAKKKEEKIKRQLMGM